MHKWKIGQKFRLKPSKYLNTDTLRNYIPGKVYRVGTLYTSGNDCFPMMEGEDKECRIWHYREREYSEFLKYWEPVRLSKRNLPEWF
jgi:hypothetical protein